MNPRARLMPVDLHRGDLRDVLPLLFDTRGYAFDYVAPDELVRLGAGIDLSQPNARLRPVGPGRHSDDVVSCVFETDAPLDLGRLNAFLDAAVQRFGPRLWRCKGIVHAEQQRQRLVVQGVHSLLNINGGAVWRPYEPRRTVLVFIGQRLDRAWLLGALRLCEARHAGGDCLAELHSIAAIRSR